jgi:hypothetical protein
VRSRFPQRGDVYFILNEDATKSSYGVIVGEREAGFSYDVMLAHVHDDLSTSSDLVVTSGEDMPTFVIECDSLMTVLARQLEGTGWRLPTEIFAQLNRTLDGEGVNTDSMWTGMPIRGLLDHRHEFKGSRVELGDELAESYLHTADGIMVIDPRLLNFEFVTSHGVSVERAIEVVAFAPSRAVVSFDHEFVSEVAGSTPLQRALMQLAEDVLVTKAVGEPSIQRHNPDVVKFIYTAPELPRPQGERVVLAV